MVGFWYTEWIQDALNIIIRLFCQYKLVENIVKSKAMLFQTGTLRSEMSEEAVGWW